MIRDEYHSFLQTLNADTTTEDVRKVANLVLKHFDVLYTLTTHQGQRVKKLATIIQSDWDTASSKIQQATPQGVESTTPVTQLQNLTVGPFRGFAKQEVLNLANKLVLIYGPNGTGKSSFCEALEFGLLGNVADADNKRFSQQSDYLKNAHTNSFVPPIITGIDTDGNEVPIHSNVSVFQFCFIEKNRIDSFSRIAAQQPAKQSELISTLFGMDDFSDFVRNFSPEISENYIDLIGIKSEELKQKRQELSNSEESIKINHDELTRLTHEKASLACQYREGATFDQMALELIGNDEQYGLISQLESELQQQLQNKSGITHNALALLQTSIQSQSTSLSLKQQELASNSKDLSFTKLYEAVVELNQVTPNHCPACKTHLAQTVNNPFEYANIELQKLKHLTNLQHECQQLTNSISLNLIHLHNIINTTCSLLTPNPLQHFLKEDQTTINLDWWNSLFTPLQDGFTGWQHLESQTQQLEIIDKKIDEDTIERTKKQAQLNRFRELEREIIVLQTKCSQVHTSSKQNQTVIDNFEKDNAKLITQVEAEKISVQHNISAVTAYAQFVTLLSSYRDSLPSHLVADLGDTVVTLYNAFNRNDPDHELLEEVYLPILKNQRLIITFKNEPQKNLDALHVLSEGHIRCLGLAILLAKNLKESCPFLIFDDPVNAIDDDHRGAIRRTLFEDSLFDEKQIILTCHGEEFFKDIHNLFSQKIASQIKQFAFLPRLGEPHIKIDANCAPRNYIVAAKRHFEKSEIRDSLAKSRQALEAITKDKVWRYVTKYGGGSLSIKLRSATAPIELRNLTEQLKKKIGKPDFLGTNKDAVLAPLTTLLGFNGNSREWSYLNKGTHEESDRREFDRQTVCDIISALELLDGAIESA